MLNVKPSERLDAILKKNGLQIQVQPAYRLLQNGMYATQILINVTETKKPKTKKVSKRPAKKVKGG